MTAEMRLLQLSDVEHLQSVVAVVGPLNEGIVSISNICKSLLDAQVDQTTGMCSNYKQIKGHIEHAEQCLEKSASMIKEKLGYLDKCIEHLIKEKENAEQQKKEKCMAKDKLNTEKKSAEESLKNSKAALEQAEKSLESAKYALRVHQDRKSTGEGVTTAGAALLILPLIGWIAGIIMICEGERVIDEASKDIRDAEDELKKTESQVKESSMKVSNYQSRISSIQNKIEETDNVLNKILRETEEVKQHLEVRAAFQEMVRSTVNLLSVLGGRVSVLERQTQRFVLWQPVMNVMEDVVKAAGNMVENQFLYSQGASGLINTLRENFGELQALCNSASNSEHDVYN